MTEKWSLKNLADKKDKQKTLYYDDNNFLFFQTKKQNYDFYATM